ncbi:tripartite tricarboxylate transporter substrate binding protein [Tabrizicola sp.]|uniref:tripartite tricarboxylate transporter substrate binding protein n=1 Tax=Tabrizicola sp. TaxID=2005166 RepID=UPI003D2A4AD5
MKALSSASVRRIARPVSRLASLLGIAAVVTALGTVLATARIPYPEQALVMVVPAPRGGGTDIFARKLAELAEEDFGQRIIIDNRPREGGLVGVRHMTVSSPDGYTVAFVWNSPLTVAPLFAQADFTPEDYRSVMSIGYSSYVMCVRPDFPASDAKGLLAALAAAPDKYSYGNDGETGTMRLAAERIFAAADISVRGVAFAGATETARNFIAGNVDIYSGSIAAILPHVKEGKAKCLLLTSAADNETLPEASGLEALGLAELETVLWWGMIAPAETPDEAITRLEQAFLDAAASPEFVATMAEKGAVWRPRGASETAEMITSEIAAFQGLVLSD